MNFEISRKEKDIAQLVIKREAAEAMLIKKDLQIDNIKKMMNQEIDGTMKKLESSQGKYQKLNEEYMQLKIESEKEIALAKQRNEFLNAKLAELVK